MPRIVRLSFYARQFIEQLDGGFRDELRDQIAQMADAPPEFLRAARGDEPRDMLVFEFSSTIDPFLRFRCYFRESEVEDALVLAVIGHTSLPPEFDV